MTIDRRAFLQHALAAAALYGAGCNGARLAAPDSPRFSARPRAPRRSLTPGAHELPANIGTATLYVPPSYQAGQPTALVIMLHGAGQSRDLMHNFYPLADAANVVLLVPKSQGRTWDLLVGGYGPDVQAIDKALDYAFERCAIDPERVAIGGFSDGASYALSVGLPNGELFRWIVALSPGFMHGETRQGRPRIFIAHGTQDRILRVESSRRIVDALRPLGYDVTYREFDGPHTIRRADVEAAFALIQSP